MEFRWQNLAFPAVLSLILFLAFPSQYLFSSTAPGPLEPRQAFYFNAQIACILVCYFRACFTAPGSPSTPPSDSTTRPSHHGAKSIGKNHAAASKSTPSRLWCRKCQAPKPPRAHHCKVCKRCILKMDHHCPWTINCVGFRTFPHFMRFIFYSLLATTYLGYFLYERLAVIWADRRRASSPLSPSALQLAHLFLLVIANSMAFFIHLVLFLRTSWCLGANTTSIEGWEMERHEVLLRRARRHGGAVNGPGGMRIRIVRHEFPYDIGIFSNIAQGMGSRNPLSWFWPLAFSPAENAGLDFETNDFLDEGLHWPPPDPDRMPMPRRAFDNADISALKSISDQDFADGVRQRQQEDLKRTYQQSGSLRHRQGYSSAPGYEHVDEGHEETQQYRDASPAEDDAQWKSNEGETLGDYGVDESTEIYDDDNVPLAVLRARQNGARLSR